MKKERVKNCSACGTTFECGYLSKPFDCWCQSLPLLFKPSKISDCWCESCLNKACEEKKTDLVDHGKKENKNENC